VDFPESLAEHDEWYKPNYTAHALRHPIGDFDYERARAGGLTVPFMSIYIPSSLQKTPGRPRQMADSLINMIYAIVQAYPEKFAHAFGTGDVTRNFAAGKISLPMGMENGAPITSVADVAYFHQRGIRYVTLTHGRDNQICDSSYDTLRTNGGLSPFGREVVREMNRVGIMVDISHLDDKSAWDVLAVARKPVVATHSGSRFFTPGFERNIPDTLIRAVAAQGGVVQVPFSLYFLSSKSREVYQAIQKELKNQGLDENTDAGRAFIRTEIGRAGFGVSQVADHIDHIKNLVGVEHVGFGADYDGVGRSLPPDLADVSMYPNLLAELIRRGYSDSDLRKICGGNLLRVWKSNE